MHSNDETLAVHAEGVTYEDALDKAISKAWKLVDGDVVRDWPDGSNGDWWLYSSETEANASGTAVSGTFVFARRYDEDEDETS